MNLLWLQSGGCGGCSMSLLCADSTDFQGHLKSAGIDLLWHPSLSLASGTDVIALLQSVLDGHTRLDALCVEDKNRQAAIICFAIPKADTKSGNDDCLVYYRPLKEVILRFTRQSALLSRLERGNTLIKRYLRDLLKEVAGLI